MLLRFVSSISDMLHDIYDKAYQPNAKISLFSTPKKYTNSGELREILFHESIGDLSLQDRLATEIATVASIGTFQWRTIGQCWSAAAPWVAG